MCWGNDGCIKMGMRKWIKSIVLLYTAVQPLEGDGGEAGREGLLSPLPPFPGAVEI